MMLKGNPDKKFLASCNFAVAWRKAMLFFCLDFSVAFKEAK